VSIYPDETLFIELRQRQLTPEGRAKLRERVAVEHTLAHVGRWQGRRARYRGLRKNLFDLRRCAVVHNLHVLARSQSLSTEFQAVACFLDRRSRTFQDARTPQAAGEATNRLHTCACRHSYAQPTRKCRRDGCRAALNAIASVAPDWLRACTSPAWFDRYSHSIEESRLPKGQAERQQYAELIGADGSSLLSLVYESSISAFLHKLPAVQLLRQTWIFQYDADEGRLRWRKAEDLPPSGLRYDSPYDPEAHDGNQRSIIWTGYKLHVTETCDDNELHSITHVETTSAGVTDSELSAPIHDALAKKALLPQKHLMDSGSVDADLLVKSQRE